MSLVHPAITAMKEPLEEFYNLTEGTVEAVSALLFAITGNHPPPPPEIFVLLKISPADVQEAQKSGKPVVVKKAALLKTLEFCVNGGVTAAEYVEKVNKHNKLVKTSMEGAKKRAEIKLSEDQALELENKLLTFMQEDIHFKKAFEAVRKLHDDWRESNKEDLENAQKFPCVKSGPEIIQFENIHKAAQTQFLGEEDREKFSFVSGQDPWPFLHAQLCVHRAKEGSPVCEAMMKRIVWLVQQTTGYELKSEQLSDKDLLKKLDTELKTLVTAPGLLAEMEKVCKAGKEGSPEQHTKTLMTVESMLSKTMAQACEKAGGPSGYEAVVFVSTVHAMQVEKLSAGFEPLDKESQIALATVRQTVGSHLLAPAAPGKPFARKN